MTQHTTGAIWLKQTRDHNPFELYAFDGHQHVTVRVPGGILSRVTYKVDRDCGLNLMSNAPSMTLAEVRMELGRVGEWA